MFGRSTPPPPAPTLFGELATSLGFVRRADVSKALQVQEHRRRRGEPVPLLGELLESQGLLTQEQIVQVFGRQLEKGEEKKPAGKPGPKPAAPGLWEKLRGRFAG